uniref:Uncharacterized protein n=1 Tax=Cannabis sativa TaxID=3483 RepID=A0A803QZL5_CANSA
MMVRCLCDYSLIYVLFLRLMCDLYFGNFLCDFLRYLCDIYAISVLLFSFGTQQLDAMAHLLRRRRTLYSEVYTRKGVVLDTSAPQIFAMY